LLLGKWPKLALRMPAYRRNLAWPSSSSTRSPNVTMSSWWMVQADQATAGDIPSCLATATSVRAALAFVTGVDTRSARRWKL
jgi:hypothetical protein